MKFILTLLILSFSALSANEKVSCNISLIESGNSSHLLTIQLTDKVRISNFEDRSLDIIVNFLYKMNGDVSIVVKDQDSKKSTINKTLTLSKSRSGALNVNAGWNKRLDVFCKKEK